MPNYRKKNNTNNNRNKNKNKNKSTSSSSVKQEIQVVESTTTTKTTTSTAGIEPNLPADVRNSYTTTSTTSAKKSVFEEKNVVVVVNSDEASSTISPLSNEEIAENASNVDIDRFNGSEEDKTIHKQSNYSSNFYSSSSCSSSSCSKKSTEIEDGQLNRAVFNLGDSTLGDSVIRETLFVNEASSGKNSFKTGSANTKDAEVSAAEKPAAAEAAPTTTQSIEITRNDESVSEKVRDLSEHRSKSTESATEVIESNNQLRQYSSKEDHSSSKVIVQTGVNKNSSDQFVTHSTPSEESSRVIVHQISNEDKPKSQQVIIHHEEQSSSTSSSHRASKNGVDLSKKTSTKAAESSTTQTLSFSNVRGQPSSRQIIYEPRKVIQDNFPSIHGPSRAIIHQISRGAGLENVKEDNSKVIVRQISREENQQSSSSNEALLAQHTQPQTTDYKLIVHQISPSSDQSKSKQQSSPISTGTFDEFGKVIDHSILQQNLTENISKRANVDQQDRFTQSFSKKDNLQQEDHATKTDTNKKVVLIPILQENSTQTSPLPSFSENPLHSHLLEIIKDDNCETNLKQSEICRQTSSSPLSRSPVICFENLSKSFELNKDQSEEPSSLNNSPNSTEENSPNVIEHPQDGSTQNSSKPIISQSRRKSPQTAENLEPLKIPSFPVTRPTRVIVHPIINENSAKPAFPFCEKSMKTLDSSSKVIANQILKEVSSELKSSILSESTRQKEEKVNFEPIRTAFPVSLKNQSSFRPGFFETNIFEKEINPLDSEQKVIVHKISTSNLKSEESKSKSVDLHFMESKSKINQVEEKVIVHQISKEESNRSGSGPKPTKDFSSSITKIQSNFPASSSFPISSEKETHATQYTSRPQDTQQKSIDLQSLRDSAELHQSSSTMTSTYGLTEMKSQTEKSFSTSILKDQPFEESKSQSCKSKINHQTSSNSKETQDLHDSTTKSNLEKSTFPVSSSFPISVEKETHASQYTSRPQDTQQKTIDLQFLRDSAEFRQSSSTMSSTHGLTTMENEKEIIHQIMKEESLSDLQKQATDKSRFPSSSKILVASSNTKELPPSGAKEIVHPIVKEESKKSHLESKETKESTNLNQDKPKVILHQISTEKTSLSRVPSFPFVSEIAEQKIIQKYLTNLKSSFPLSTLIINHPEQYNSKSTLLEQKTINFEKLRNGSKFNQTSASPFAMTKIKEIKDQNVFPKSYQSSSPSASSNTPFPLSVRKQGQSSFSSQPNLGNKSEPSSFPATSSFPIAVGKEIHASQYTARPQDSQQKTIDLQSLRDSAEFRQSSSTMTSTYGLTEMENKKEIIHQILQEEPPSDLQKQDVDKLFSSELLNVNIDHQSKEDQSSSPKTSTVCPKNTNQPKEIVHPILRETSGSDLQSQSSDLKTPSTKESIKSSDGSSIPKEIIRQIVKEDSSSDLPAKTYDHQTSQDESISSSEGSVLTAIQNESPRSISPPTTEEPKTNESSDGKSSKRSFFLAPLELPNKTQSEAIEVKQELQMISPEFVKVFNHPIVRQIEKPLGYRVESPQPEKISTIVKKSKSFDDDDVVIQEMSDTSSAGDTDNPPVISEAESETDTIEAVDDFPDLPTSSSLLSIQTLPIDQENDSLSPKSSQEYKSRRQQNRAALESHFLPQFLAPNFLDSIKEENSDLSDSDRRSSCSDRVDAPVHHGDGDLDDDVFLDPPKKANAVYPKSNLDFSKKHKHVLNFPNSKTSVIREEASPPSVVEAKIIDQGSIAESCSSWSTDLTPESEAAEVVYIDSASSSVSDLLELDYSQGQPDDSIDVRIQTPTIDLESVNEMFATCQQIESNDRKKYIPPSEKPPPPPPVNDDATTTTTTAAVQQNINERNLLPSHNKNDVPNTTKLNLENEKEKFAKVLDEIISEKIETMSETAGDTHKHSDDVSGAGTSMSAENSIANNLNSCDSAIDQIVTSNTSPSVSTANATAAAVVVVGSINNMENIREIVNNSSASPSKRELDTTDHGFSKPNFMIGQPCSDHTFKCDTNSSSLTSSSSASSSSTTTNTTTTTTTRILTLHDLSQSLDNTKHLNNPLVSPCSSALDRQESLDSHGSDQSHSTNQSQCTAINQGSLPHCDWNEFDTTTDTTYVSESDTAAGLASSEASSPLTTKGAETSGDETESLPIRKLRSLCTETLASMPYGEEVLEELATVAKNIRDMPYPLPDLPQIQDIQLSLGAAKPERTSVITLSQVPPRPAAHSGQKFKSPPPPPVPEPPSKYDSWLGVPTESDPNVLVCLSPSQRNAVKSDSTADSLLDMHKKFVERRGYHEYTTKQVNAINQANNNNNAEAPKFSKVDSPPPPPLPPRPPTQLSNPNGNTDINDDDDEDDENNHRLLAIIRDTHENQQHQQKSSMTSTSENISRRTESGIHNVDSTTKDERSSCLEKEFPNTPCSVNKQSQERKFISESNKSNGNREEMQQSESENSAMHGGESVMGMKFPTSEYFDSIFDGKNKRFSNIETGSAAPQFCSQILATQPKRYSNIETSSFESKKCVENGKILYDVSDVKREKISEGEKPDSSNGSAIFPEFSKTKTNGLEGSFPFATTASRSATDDSRPQTGGDSENIMSAFKLNTTQMTAPPPASASRVESSPPAPPVPPLPQTTLTADTTATGSTVTTKSTSTSESHINRTFNAKVSEQTFDDFGQRAKEAASTTTTTGNRNESSSSSTDKKPSDAFQHEKLFKQFDELSNLLKDELDSGKRRPPATLNGNDIPSSVIDYNRVARESKIQNSHVSSTTSTETNRREQMKKLAEEIDRTSKHKLQQRREMRIPIIIEKSTETGPQSAPILSHEPRSYDIPVRVEGGHSNRPNLLHQRSYEIPIHVEQSSNGGRQRTYSEHQSQPRTHEIPIQIEKPTPDRFRRAESMFNISESTEGRHHLHHDDWMKYVGDLGSSENVCKPFQREVEICYLGRRPNIRAPRMSASTSDLSSIQTFDTHGAYDVRRTAQTPRPQQPPRRAYLSTQSLIDTTPITSCVSARRSPAPERRSSLPREIHDKQLKYITSKEQQLKYEFERLENERRHLIDEMNRVQMNQRISREAYRQRQLPPLTEDESFRQQMAEEWLDKVAEREERRLQKIIKISKINQEAGVPVAPPRRHSTADEIGDEFLRRVKERRSKLCMPSDSDWESGAESQPLPRTDGSRSENEEPPVTVFEGQSTTNFKQLPKHLREFAKLTSQVKEEHRQEMTENSSSSASKMTALKTTVKTASNNHSTHQESQSMQQDAAHVRDLEQQLQPSHNGKRPKLVTILRHKKPAECSGGGGSGSGGASNCQQSGSSTTTTANSAIKRRKQTRFLLTPNRRSWSESDLLREIDKDLVLAKGFLYANESIEMFAPKFKATAPPGSGVWTPKNQTPTSSRTNLNDSHPHPHHHHHNRSSSNTNSSPVKDRRSENRSSSACGRSSQKGIPTPPPPPLWTPQPERKQFRPVHFESPILQRKYVQQQSSSSEVPSPPWSYTNSQPFSGYQSQSCTNLSSQKDTAISWPPQASSSSSSQVVHTAGTKAIVNEVVDDDIVVVDDEGFSPTTSIAEKIRSFERSNSNNELHRPLVRHNPHEKPAILKPNEVIFSLKNEYMSEPETEYDKPKKMAQLSRRQYDGIGPTTKHGMPLVLRSEVKEPNQHEWYKRIFQTIHKQKNPGRYPYKANGYMSEPEPNYDSDYSTVKYRTLERRRLQSTGGTDSRTSAAPTGNESQDETFYGTMPNPVKSGQGSYKVQPGRIENYITGQSSVSEKEKKEWWDEVMDIFNGQLDQQKLSPHYTEGNLSRALLKEQGYTSDSNLVFRKKDVPILQSPLSPVEQKQVYKSVQAGGQPPLFGFRKPAPEKPKETEFEYLPITPTLTKIRVHSKDLVMSSKNHRTSAERGEFIYYPITNIARPTIDVFAPFPKNVPSFIPLHQAPMPPNRKSSRVRTNSMALKISSSQVRRPTSANSSRHEACFQTKDAISPTPPSKPAKYGTITLRKTVKRTEPLMRSKSAGAVVSILTAAKEEKSRDGRVSRKQQSVRLSSSSPVRSASRLSTFRATSRSPVAFGRSVSKERSFAEEKKRIEESLPSVRTDFTASTNILRDPRLRSPDQVKRAVRSYAFPIERSKSAPRVLPPIKPAMSSYVSTYVVRRIPSPPRKDAPPKRGQSSTSTRILMKPPAVQVRSKSQSSSKLLDSKTSSKPLAKTSSTLSLARTSSTFSVDSIAPKAKPVQKNRPLSLTICKPTSKTETEKPKRKPISISSSKSDSNVLTKIRESPEIKKKIIKAIPMQQKIVRTNQFFQNLFMRDHSPKRDEPVRQASVHEKMRYWNTMSLSPKRAICDSRTITYRSLSPPARPHFVEEYDSVAHFHSDDEDSEFGDRSGRTEDLVWQYEQRSRSEPRPVKQTKKPICDIARPESPIHTPMREFSPTREIRVPQTREMRSPSRRRIQNFRESQRSETGKVIRASSLSSADDRSKKSLYNCDEFSHSANSLDYIERHSPSCRFSNSDRFIDLNRFYSTLERVGQLERATSANSLKPIRKEGEPLDFEEWRKIRSHERAERELSYLVGKLKEDQKQKDFLFRPKDVEDVKWIGNRDLSLKSKEKSVEDLRENFEKKIHQEWLDENKRIELESKKDTYKPYWRGSSVVDLASNMEIKFNSEKGSYGVQKTKSSEAPPEKPLCLSNRLISTLSKDQVTKITQQLNEIYNASEPKTKPDVTEDFVITVDKQMPCINALKVRCNSSISKDELIGPVLRRKEASEKSAAQSKKIENEFTEADKKRLSQNFSREIQGKARSSSPNIVGRETRGAIAAENAKLTPHEIPPPPPLPTNLNETKKPAPVKPKRKPTEDQKTKVEKALEEQTPDAGPSSLEIMQIEQSDETVSKKIQYFEERKFDESPKTIYHAREDSSPDEDEIMRVIEANIKARAESGKYHHQEMSSSVMDLKDLFGEKESSRINFPIPRLPPPPDEKTIYHETKLDENRSTSLTLRASRQGSNEELETLFRSRSASPQSKETSYLHRVNTGEVQKIKDKFESLGRPKKKKHFFALSPLRKVRSDPELSNDGSKDTFRTIVREHELGDVSWIAHKFEVRQSSGRGRSRVRKLGSPIQRMPIRKEDRLMPHIDVISKTASLKQEMMKSRSPSPARPPTVIHSGGIERIRSIFETSPDRTTSPVGQPRLGTSSPELRDISPHLTASWIAHKFPRPMDNNIRSPPPPRPLALPPSKPLKLAKSDSLPIKEAKRHERCYRSRSSSPPKSTKQNQPVTSILKPRFDFFANQKFDPLMHRPKARYVPDTGDVNNLKQKSSHLSVKKTTAVKFKDEDDVPTPPVPPTKGVPLPLDSNGSYNYLESPNRYFESDVNIHYKTPIRYEYKDPIPEEELAIRQAETMQKLYQEERRRKYLQELQDMNSRRHTDNFTPSQKSPIPLNRYDDFNSDLAPKSPNTNSNYPRTVARALYNFQGQTARELTFKKGDVIYIRRQIDKNWYEGEHNAMIGLLPSNYVELLTKDGIRQPPKKPSEGQARAKYNFQAQSGIELSLNKGEHVTLTRRVDENWYEGKIANRKGIFPVSYVEVLVDIGAEDRAGRLPATQSIITQSSSSMRPSLDTLRTNINNEFNSLTSNGQPPNGILRETRTHHKTEVLHVDTNTEPVAYRALYKYRPQNTDELELQEGDIVFVLEKCDDGWFVGTSQRSGCFGTFPGNYVERV